MLSASGENRNADRWNRTCIISSVITELPVRTAYRIWQQPGSNSRGYYDRTVYYIKITVTNGENNKLESAAAVYRDSEMKGKKSEIIFTNTYEKKKESCNKTTGR